MKILCFALIILFTQTGKADWETIVLERDGHRFSFKISSKFPADKQSLLHECLKQVLEIKDGPGTKLHQEIFGGPVDGITYLKWLSDRISEFDYEAEYTYMAYYRKYDNLWAGLLGERSHRIHLSEKSFYDSGSLLFLFGALIHEARHADGFEHNAVCDPHFVPEIYDRLSSAVGLEAWNNKICDDEALGAYAVQTVFMLNVVGYHPEWQINALFVPGPEHIMSRSAKRLLNEDLLGPMEPRSVLDMICFGDEKRLKQELENSSPSKKELNSYLAVAKSTQAWVTSPDKSTIENIKQYLILLGADPDIKEDKLSCLNIDGPVPKPNGDPSQKIVK